MDTKQLQQLKKTLLEEKAEIETQLSKIAKKNPDIKGDWTAIQPNVSDPSDTLDEKAQNVTDYEERRAIEQNFEIRLRAIEQTLERIDQGVYGICGNCKLPIDIKRLKAVPAVKHCMDCANNPNLV